MSTQTKKLKLLKKSVAEDGADTFNVDTMLNDNWDKVDKFAEDVGETLDETNDEINHHTGDTVKHITASERTAWNAKQGKLTFDTAPTSGSTNPVTSSGVKTAIDNAVKNKVDLVGGKVPSSQLPEMDYASKDLSNITGVYKSVLDKLEVANRYTWIKSYKELGEIKETALTEDLYLTRASGTGSSYAKTITVLNNLAIKKGEITYTTGSTIDITYNTSEDTIKSTIAGKYIIGCYDNKAAIYKISSSATIKQGRDSNSRYCRYISASEATLVAYSVKRAAYTETLTSTNRNAYSDSDETDDYILAYSGNALDNSHNRQIVELCKVSNLSIPADTHVTFDLSDDVANFRFLIFWVDEIVSSAYGCYLTLCDSDGVIDEGEFHITVANGSSSDSQSGAPLIIGHKVDSFYWTFKEFETRQYCMYTKKATQANIKGKKIHFLTTSPYSVVTSRDVKNLQFTILGVR